MDPRQRGALMDVVITRSFLGICHMQVCATWHVTDEEILRVCNSKNPSGTSLGWCRVIRSQDEGKLAPVPCADDSSRLHILVAC